jgi:hypothetical protein
MKAPALSYMLYQRISALKLQYLEAGYQSTSGQRYGQPKLAIQYLTNSLTTVQ